MAVDILRIISSILLFGLVFGMSATVDIGHLKSQLKNVRAIIAGLAMQFIVMPLFGFLTVKMFNLDSTTGMILLVLCSSPGGSYSNWFCSIMNADLALSVTLTAISTCLSMVLLPVNLLMYTQFAYGADISSSMDWGSLALALFLVISAICAGLFSSYYKHSHEFNLHANILGNYCGLILIVFAAIISSSHKDARLWDRDASFYVGVALPCLVALILGNVVTIALKLPKPEVVTVAIESCFQNVGIAMSVSLAMYQGEELAMAVAVPFYFGIMQAIFTFLYCILMWKLNWTKAPSNVSFWTMISTSYELLLIDQEGVEPHKEADGFYYVDHKDTPQDDVDDDKPVMVQPPV